MLHMGPIGQPFAFKIPEKTGILFSYVLSLFLSQLPLKIIHNMKVVVYYVIMLHC